MSLIANACKKQKRKILCLLNVSVYAYTGYCWKTIDDDICNSALLSVGLIYLRMSMITIHICEDITEFKLSSSNDQRPQTCHAKKKKTHSQ